MALRAEVIAIGTELLMGEVVNSNATYLSKAMASMGIDVYYHTALGDNPQRIQEQCQQSLSRSNILLITGGLGPTDDDLTVQTLADMLDTPMVLDETSAESIQSFFIARGMPMSPTNIKQAKRPEDGEALYNRVGTAPGLFWDVTDKVVQKGWGTGPKLIVCLPGVPLEMKTIWEEVLQPKFKSRFPSQSILVSRSLKFFGIGESLLGEKLNDLMSQASPTVSPYVGDAEVRIRIAAKATSQEEGLQAIAPTEKEIKSRVGEFCYGTDEDTLSSVVATLLKQKNLHLLVAESCTGGLLSSFLTDIPGSSDYTLFNVVTYSNEAKQQHLNVNADTLATHGAVSPETAAEMAQGILQHEHDNISVAITGIAGPDGGSPEKPIGLAYVGLAGLSDTPITKEVRVNPEYPRERIKAWFAQYALHYVRLYLSGLLDPNQ